ncbi:MAG TPA: AarF/ABC1/UbiB kinase family protein [Dongiaceae bacterium]|nr:AarF/ABC1/UbiB kinase family protein [Dongiaceae bacterium]
MTKKPEQPTLRQRSWTTTKLAARLGMAAASKALGLELPQSNDKAVAQALALVNQFDGMKGLMLKFGQMASYLNPSLPPEAQKILAQLQSAATAMPYSAVVSQIESSLGAPVNDLFDRFETEAFAAASIGQVHRAEFQGVPVAVKVQYPGIQDLIKHDLKNVGLFAQVLLMGSKMDGAALTAELSQRLLEECDYTLEARRQHAVSEAWNRCEGRVVPKVWFDRCSPLVMTSSLETGANLADHGQHADEAARRRSSLILFQSTFDGIFRHGFFNADPHPGNFLFRPNGDVVFLDFGCLRTFDTEFLTAWKSMAKAVLDNDRRGFREAHTAMGFVANPRKFDWDFQWEMIDRLYQPYKSTKPYRYDKRHVAENFDRMVLKNRNRFSMRLPPNQLFVNRLQWGLYSVLADLNVDAVYSDLFREAVEARIEPIPGLH